MGTVERWLGGAVCALALCLVLSASAAADITFCGTGSGAGQCVAPAGVAVNNATGNVYVADQGNDRVDVFNSAGSFAFAFGWGVADGAGAELQTCTVTCFPGFEGGGAGEFAGPARIAVDPAAPHDVYVFEQSRVQRFSSSGAFIRAWGGGTITGGASGKGELTSGSPKVDKVATTSKAFEAGQAISGSGIPAGTRILALGPGRITLSKDATASGTGVTLTAPEGAGNKPVNEVQVLNSLSDANRGISFSTPNPLPSTDFIKTPLPIPSTAPASGPGSVQEMLVNFSNLDPGDISVTGPNGGPYTIEFIGRYADTNVDSLRDLDSQDSPLNPLTSTTQNGASSFENCTIASDCAAGVQGGGAGQFNNRNEPIAVGPGGGVYVGDSLKIGFVGTDVFSSRIEKFAPSGIFAEEVGLPGTTGVGALAVDSGGNFYLGRNGVEKFDPAGTLLYTLSLNNLGAIATAPDDHLFASHFDGQDRAITELDPAGTVVRRFGYGSIAVNLGGLAVNETASGDIYGSEPDQDRIRYLSFPSPGPLPCCTKATASNTKATLKGGVNPEGKASTYHFEYVNQASFETEGGFASPKTVKTPESAATAANFSLIPAAAQVGCATPVKPLQPECLTPETTYRFRLVAKNEVERSVEGEFKTLPFFEIKSTWATSIGITTAKLHAAVNPLGIEAAGFFEYVDDASYQADLAKGAGHDGFAEASKAPSGAPLGFGSGEVEAAAETEISTLTADTIYHYRAVAADLFLTKTSAEHTLRTRRQFEPRPGCPNDAFRVGAAANLPDCRAYEMVSPVDKNGGDIKALVSGRGYPARLEASSTEGDSFTYSAVASFADPKSAPYSSQYLATRQEGVGWSTQATSPPREAKSIDTGIVAKLDVQYKAFALDLTSGWLIQDTDPPLDGCAPAGFINLYRRDNASGSYEALTTAAPLNNSPSGYVPELQELSADGTHAVFRANGKLTAGASDSLGGGTAPIYQLYEHVKGPGCGQLRLVSVRPDGSPSALASSAGTLNPGVVGEARANTVARAVSADGSRIFWSTGVIGSGPLYARIAGSETVEIASEGAHFWAAAPDGSKVVYSVGQKLFEALIAPGSSTPTLIAEGFKGVAGASADASRVYFVSTKALAGEGEAGKPNLYLHKAGGSTSLVATLYGGDTLLPGGDLNPGFELSGFGVGRADPVANGVRVTPDGAHLAFVSAQSIGGYDNADVADGLPALELYLYDMATGKVACVSCNPTGGRPEGRKFEAGEGVNRVARRVSAQMPAAANQLFTPRALADDGNRLFFESFEALVGRDENNAADVYEWERAASQKECDDKGAELFVPSAGGCLSLISAGEKGSGDSELADASPDGSDAFIRTGSSLLPQDPGQVDIYDVREGGGFPIPPARKIPCETPENPTSCQSSTAPPNDPTPASAGPSSGNVKTTKPCPKGKVRRKGKCVKKPHGKPKHSKHSNNKSKGARR